MHAIEITDGKCDGRRRMLGEMAEDLHSQYGLATP